MKKKHHGFGSGVLFFMALNFLAASRNPVDTVSLEIIVVNLILIALGMFCMGMSFELWKKNKGG